MWFRSPNIAHANLSQVCMNNHGWVKSCGTHAIKMCFGFSFLKNKIKQRNEKKIACTRSFPYHFLKVFLSTELEPGKTQQPFLIKLPSSPGTIWLPQQPCKCESFKLYEISIWLPFMLITQLGLGASQIEKAASKGRRRMCLTNAHHWTYSCPFIFQIINTLSCYTQTLEI